MVAQTLRSDNVFNGMYVDVLFFFYVFIYIYYYWSGWRGPNTIQPPKVPHLAKPASGVKMMQIQVCKQRSDAIHNKKNKKGCDKPAARIEGPPPTSRWRSSRAAQWRDTQFDQTWMTGTRMWSFLWGYFKAGSTRTSSVNPCLSFERFL